MLLCLLPVLISSRMENYTTSGLFTASCGLVDGTRKFFRWKAEDYIGTDKWPFTIGQYQNYEFLDNYYWGFLADGFTFGLIAAIVFLICACLGLVARYCFNDKREARNKCLCIMAFIFLFLTVILILAAAIIAFVASIQKKNLYNKDDREAAVNSIYDELSKIYYSIRGQTEILAYENGTKQVYEWTDKFQLALKKAGNFKGVITENFLTNAAATSKTNYQDHIQQYESAKNDLETYAQSHTDIIDITTKLTSKSNNFNIKNVTDAYEQRNTVDKEYLYGITDNTERLKKMETLSAQYIDEHIDLQSYVKQLTNAILVLNSRGVPALKTWVEGDFNDFTNSFKIEGDQDSFAVHVKNYQDNSQIYLYVFVVGAIIAIAGLVMASVFILAPKMNIAVAGFLTGIGFCVFCFGIGSYLGYINFILSSDKQLRLQFNGAAESNQKSYFDMFDCKEKSSVLAVFNYLPNQTDGSLTSYFANYEKYLSKTDEIKNTFAQLALGPDVFMVSSPDSKTFFRKGEEYEQSISSRLPDYIKGLTSLSAQNNNFYVFVNTYFSLDLSNVFSDWSKYKDAWKKLMQDSSGCHSTLPGKTKASEFWTELDSCGSSLQTDVSTIKNSPIYEIKDDTKYNNVADFITKVRKVASADNQCQFDIASLVVSKLNSLSINLNQLYAINITYINGYNNGDASWKEFNDATKKISEQQCDSLGNAYNKFITAYAKDTATYVGAGVILALAALICFIFGMIFTVLFKYSWGNRVKLEESSSYVSDSKSKSKSKTKSKKKSSSSSSFSEEAPRLSQRGMASSRGLNTSGRPSSQRGMGSQRGLASSRGFAGVPPSRRGASSSDSSSSSSSS